MEQSCQKHHPKKQKRPVEELSYEEALAELEEIVSALEGSEQSQLEEAIKLFERGRLWRRVAACFSKRRNSKVKQVVGEDVIRFRGRVRMNLLDVFQNKALIAGLAAWLLAQVIKMPLDYFQHAPMELGVVSHHGRHAKFTFVVDDRDDACDWVVSWIRQPALRPGRGDHDDRGVRCGRRAQQAGIHAQRINVLFDELLHGHPINEKDLREVLGHTPLEVIGGILLGSGGCHDAMADLEMN